jgi:GYF domain 2
VEEGQWHYRDERNGKRFGPVERDEVEKAIAEARIERSTLVWNTAMPQWVAASLQTSRPAAARDCSMRSTWSEFAQL